MSRSAGSSRRRQSAKKMGTRLKRPRIGRSRPAPFRLRGHIIGDSTVVMSGGRSIRPTTLIKNPR